jgi:HNH endonuclease
MKDDELRKILNYEPETGVFTCRVRPNKRTRLRVGDVAGSVRPDGYRAITLNGCRYAEHRLVWFFTEGEWPRGQLDHVNGNKGDNRRRNLRLADNSKKANTPVSKGNSSGYKGVHWHRHTSGGGAWHAAINVNGKRAHIASSESKVAAAFAYDCAALFAFGPFARTNFTLAELANFPGIYPLEKVIRGVTLLAHRNL